jgi:hypothetical protein
MMRNLLLFLCFGASLWIYIPTAQCVEIALLGPEQYARTNGKPDIFSDKFISEPGNAKIIVTNGEKTGTRRLDAAEIRINGKVVFGSKDFSQNVYLLESPINLEINNNVDIKLSKGSSGSFLNICVTREVPFIISIEQPEIAMIVNKPWIQLVGKLLMMEAPYPSVYVNKKPANVYGSSFLLPRLDLYPGENLITIEAFDSKDNATQKNIIITRQDDFPGWIEMDIESAGVAPFETQLKIISHFNFELNYHTAVLLDNGPASIIIDQVSDKQYNLQIDEPGTYTMNYQVTDINGIIHEEQFYILVHRAFTHNDWLEMDSNIQELIIAYNNLSKMIDIDIVRNQVLAQAKQNPNFSSAVLSSDGSISLEYKGFYPVILELPNPNTAHKY